MLMAGCALLGPQAPERPAAKASVSTIAYIGGDDHVYVAEPDGSAPRALTQQVTGRSNDQDWTFRWPTYSPDGRRLAFAGYRTRAGQLLSAAVLSADVGQSASRVVIESADLAP